MLPQACDVLVLGAGLAGLRAALSCLQSAPELSVAVASLSPGPSGSSFANQNDALGIHVCLTDAEREAYVREVLALNNAFRPEPSGRSPRQEGWGNADGQEGRAGGAKCGADRGVWLSSELLAVQAEEGEARLRDLEALGLPFVRDDAGRLLPHSSCFSPGSRRAYVFKGLARAYQCFRQRLDSLGCRFLPGWMPVSILRAARSGSTGGAPVAGVALAPAPGGGPPRGKSEQDSSSRAGKPEFMAAKAVVVALGGPGRLFSHSMAGPNPGYGQGLLVRAGADMANLGFLQYMWGSLPGKTFWQPAELASGGWRLAVPPEEPVSTARGAGRDEPPGARSGPGQGIPGDCKAQVIPLEELVPELSTLSARRAGHCPFGCGLRDSPLDQALASGLDENGTVMLLQPDGRELRVAPMAHASNGGAVIDADSQTSVPGLLACGECATGMHGANRIGGAMVLATQVFGHRAGVRAARIAREADHPEIDFPDGAAPGTGGATRIRAAATDRTVAAHRAPLTVDEAERKEGLEWLAQGLSRFAVLGGRPGHSAFAAEVRECLAQVRDWRLSLCLETGLGILDELPFNERQPG